MQCPECAAESDHCHGTLIVHVDRTYECTDPGCTSLSLTRHRLTVECSEIAPPCGCAASPDRARG